MQIFLVPVAAESLSDVDAYEDRLYAIRNLVWQLPRPSFDLMAGLAKHLFLVSEHELDNQMHASNLAVIFAPTLFKPPNHNHNYGVLS